MHDAEAHPKHDRSRTQKFASGWAVAIAMATCLLASSAPGDATAQDPGWSLSSEYRVSDLSGDVGDRTETLDLEVNGLQVLRIGQQGGGSHRPCNVVLLGWGPGDYREDTSRTRVNWNRCVSYFRDDPGWTRILEGVYDEDFYIKSLRVCQTRKKNDRIKGLQSGAVRVTASGEVAETDSQSMTNPDCAQWHRLVRCRPDEVASGIRVRYNGASQTPEITGLELVCRRVVPTNPETAGAGLESRDPDGAETEGAAGIAIGGNWRRTDSNNPQNDGMRISVQGDQATLTALPGSGHRTFRIGHVLWKGISNDGRLEVRGSDGQYYSASLTMEGTDRLHIDIDDDPGPGYEQTWQRAGPSIDGDWALAVSGDGRNEGLRVVVQGDRATVAYVPATAERGLRVGTVYWREIGGHDRHIGRLEVFAAGRTYEPGQFRLLDEDRLRLVFDAGGNAQLWTRPGAVESARAEVAGTTTGVGEESDPGGQAGGQAGADPGDEGRIVGLRLADDYTVSALSGNSGERSAIVDLEAVPVKALRVQQATELVNSPCEVAVSSEPVGTFTFTPTTGNYRRDQFSECAVRTFLTTPVPGANGDRIVSDYREGYYLQSLRVCQRRANGRVKGFQTSAVRVAIDRNADAVSFHDVDSQEVTLTNCNDWDNPIVRCEQGSVASGVRLRYDVVANDRAEVTGLELVCRAVEGVRQ